MPILDKEIFGRIDKIREHYQSNINNRFLRKAVMMLSLDRETRDALERLTESTDYYKVQGYSYEELYDQIFAAATFIHQVKNEMLPNLKNLLAGQTTTVFSRSTGDKEKDGILREIAINNFPSNLNIFSDMINDLYLKTVETDKRDHPKEKAIYERRKELKELGRLLI